MTMMQAGMKRRKRVSPVGQTVDHLSIRTEYEYLLYFRGRQKWRFTPAPPCPVPALLLQSISRAESSLAIGVDGLWGLVTLVCRSVVEKDKRAKRLRRLACNPTK